MTTESPGLWCGAVLRRDESKTSIETYRGGKLSRASLRQRVNHVSPKYHLQAAGVLLEI